MTLNPNLVQTGVANGTPIMVDVGSGLGTDTPMTITLTADYVLANPRPVGFPFRPFMTGASQANLDYPRTLLSGSVISVLRPEALALIAAGVAHT